MKKLLILISGLCALSICRLEAQESGGAMIAVDSVIYRPAATVDESLVGKSIFYILAGSGVSVSQDAAVSSAMQGHISSNSSRKINGYRIRIFFDNKKSSRNDSEAALRRFQAAFPGVTTYRTFTSPFFKVAVGDFRTKSEASAMLKKVKGMFPAAFIIKEQINYPTVDKEHSYVTDTVKVYRPAPEV